MRGITGSCTVHMHGGACNHGGTWMGFSIGGQGIEIEIDGDNEVEIEVEQDDDD